MANETEICSNPDCNHARIGHFAPTGCMMPGCHCPRTYGNADAPPGTTSGPTPATPASSASAPTGPVLNLPADCIVSPCKISPGRFVPVVVPLHLSKAEAQRLIAFILSSADDNAPPEVESSNASEQTKG